MSATNGNRLVYVYIFSLPHRRLASTFQHRCTTTQLTSLESGGHTQQTLRHNTTLAALTPRATPDQITAHVRGLTDDPVVPLQCRPAKLKSLNMLLLLMMMMMMMFMFVVFFVSEDPPVVHLAFPYRSLFLVMVTPGQDSDTRTVVCLWLGLQDLRALTDMLRCFACFETVSGLVSWFAARSLRIRK
jgi:hypothetical protein